MAGTGHGPAGSRPRRVGGPGWWPRESDTAAQRGPLVYAVFRIWRKNRAMAAEYLRPLGLYPGQELLLLQLAEGERRSQRELVDALGIDHSTVTKMLQRLERAGVVARQQSANDRRVVLVQLTEEGCVHRRAVEQMWARMEAAASGGLSEEQHAQLLELLRRVEGCLDQLGQRSPDQ
ncbi:MAG: MarR family winged helix-turn-helix transcriptional regulator [Streptosporangiaceae bacterium]